MILLVTGSRHLSDPARVWSVLAEYHAAYPDTLRIYVGDCPTGADQFTRIWCEEYLSRDRWRVFEADWRTSPRFAGNLRNEAMVHAKPQADRCVAFLEVRAPNRGTNDCVQRARWAGIPTTVYGEDETEQESLPF